jgi:hypothetical protein
MTFRVIPLMISQQEYPGKHQEQQPHTKSAETGKTMGHLSNPNTIYHGKHWATHKQHIMEEQDEQDSTGMNTTGPVGDTRLLQYRSRQSEQQHYMMNTFSATFEDSPEFPWQCVNNGNQQNQLRNTSKSWTFNQHTPRYKAHSTLRAYAPKTASQHNDLKAHTVNGFVTWMQPETAKHILPRDQSKAREIKL